MNSNQLIECFKDTMDICNSDVLKQSTQRAVNTSKVYFENIPRFSFAEDNTIFLLKSSNIIVENNTSFNAAKKHLQYGKVAVLNFANLIIRVVECITVLWHRRNVSVAVVICVLV